MSFRHLDSGHERSILVFMRTTLNIDDELLAEAQRTTGIGSKTKVIEMALRSLIERAAFKRLAALHGTIPKATAPERRRMRRRSK